MNLEQYNSDFQALVESLCQKHKALKHSANNRRFYNSVEEFKGNSLQSPSVICVPAISNFEGKNADTAVQRYEFDVMIVLSPREKSDAAIREAHTRAEIIAIDFISAFEKLASSYDGPDSRKVFAFDVSKCKVDLIGPFKTDWYGAILTVQPGSMRDISFKPENWTEAI